MLFLESNLPSNFEKKPLMEEVVVLKENSFFCQSIRNKFYFFDQFWINSNVSETQEVIFEIAISWNENKNEIL